MRSPFLSKRRIAVEIKMSLIPGGKCGKAGKISVKPGDKVRVGDILVQVETAKGNRPVKATEAGIVTRILCEEGCEIVSNQSMFELKIEGVETETNEACPQTEKTPVEKTAKKMKAELLIIGAGPGGYVAAIYAAKKGLKVTLIEKEELGGTCLNVGCIPTKALVKSSEICRNVRESCAFGINTEGLCVDMDTVIRRKNEVKEKLVGGIGYLIEQNRIQLIRGQAAFLSENEVSVTGETNYDITAENIIVATGSRITEVNIPGIYLPFVMNSTDALACNELPASITIIGGGVIGMEFAFIYRNLGVQVHVVEFMDRLLTMVDRDVSQEIQNIAQKAGIVVHTSSKVTKIQCAADGQAIVTYEDKKGEQLLVSDKVLVAIGREPNLTGLDIEKAGIQLNKRGKGIAVDKRMCTNAAHVYAIGDVTNIIQLAHVASHQGIIAVDNILGESKEMDYSAVPNVIFSAPEIASVGLTEAECKENGMDYSVSRVDFASNGKALTMNEPAGFVKLIKDNGTEKIVGGAIIGADASSLISTLTLAIANGLTDQEITKTIFAHPTTAEVIHESALGFGIGALHQA